VYLDGESALSVRARTFAGMNLRVGDRMTLGELTKREKHFWKKAYGQKAWVAEKVRLDRVSHLLRELDHRVGVTAVGFGADTTDGSAPSSVDTSSRVRCIGRSVIAFSANGQGHLNVVQQGTERTEHRPC
jgi:hypothetical protein